MPDGNTLATLRPRQAGEPFGSVQAAWFWAWRGLQARQDGAGAAFGQRGGPCEVDDVIRCVDRAYRQGRVTLAHARVLRVWGERNCAPDPTVPAERGDARMWKQAMDAMAPIMRSKGIVR